MSIPIPDIPKKRETKLNRSLFLILLCIGLLIPATFVVWRIRISFKVNSELAALRKAGYPTSMQELERMYYPKLKPEENAATFFNEAFQHLDLTNSAKGVLTFTILSNQRLSKGSIHFSSEDRAKILKSLAENREALEMLRKTPAAKACRYPVDVNKGLAMPMAHLANIRESAKLLMLEAILDAEDNKPSAAMENLHAAFYLSQSLSEEPWLISQLTRVLCRGEISFCLEHILNNQQLTEAQLLDLSEAFRRAQTPHAMEHAIAGDLCMGIHLFRTPDKKLVAPLLMTLSGMNGKDFDYFLRTMSRRLDESKLPFPAKLDAADDARTVLEKEIHHSLYVYSAVLLPSGVKVATSEANDLARMNIIQSVLAIERYRLANQNRIPDKLDNLVPSFLPAIPSDPFDGKPLRFKKTPKGYMVYSIGSDRKDDGGMERNPKRPGSPADITFTVER